MGELVNLRLVRKARVRDDKARAAEENRARHGRSKSEKQLDRLSAEISATFLDGHQRATPTSPSRGEVAPPPGPANGWPEDRLRGAGGGADASPAPAVDAEHDTGIDSDTSRD